MRAIQFSQYGPPDVMEIADVDEPHAGPGQVRIAVRASSVSPGEVRLRAGEHRQDLPLTFPYRTGFDAAGVVDEVGAGVADAHLGDELFGIADQTARGANADFVVLTAWARKPEAWTWAEAAGAASGAEVATRVLDLLDVAAGHTVLVNGAAGGTGVFVVQLAVARGATVVGTASEQNHGFLRGLGAEATTYGPGLVERVAQLAPSGVDAVVDCAGGALADLVTLAGDPSRVVTIADTTAARHHVRMTHGGVDPLALHGLAVAAGLADQGRLRVPVAAEFQLAEAAAAHELSETRHARGKIVLIH
jgi:NADPH:quinone reductase-like Zn-dependent oxidoreductase